MKRTTKYSTVDFLSVASLSVAGAAFLLGPQPFHHEIDRTKEKEVHVSLDAAFGKVSIGKGVSDKILIADFQDEEGSGLGVDISYKVKKNVGHLHLEPGERSGMEKTVGGKHWKVSGLESGAWDLNFTDNVPLAFDI